MLLTNREREFLAVFIHEATTDPFKGPATQELHRRDIYYDDLSHLLAAYYRERSAGPQPLGPQHVAMVPPARGRTGRWLFSAIVKSKRNWSN
jgi:hypothetical protein